MRLIDAEKLRQKDMNGDMVDIFDVLEAPIVKAIPIDWIMWVWRRNQPDDTQEDVWMRLGVLKMLNDWEKENE